MKLPSFTLRGFKRPREVAGLELGRLERQVMDQCLAARRNQRARYLSGFRGARRVHDADDHVAPSLQERAC